LIKRSILWVRESVVEASRYIVWLVTVLHLLWAILLWLQGPKAYGATSLHLWDSVPPVLFGALLFVVGLLGILSVEFFFDLNKLVATLLVLPQQVVLAVSAYAVVQAVVESQYGDGVIRPRVFILADQAPLLIVFLVHLGFVLNLGFLAYREAKPEEKEA
jgi:hypothetical protein